MLKSVLLLLSGNAFASLLLLVRNLVVARLISVEDYGVAATFAIAMAIVEITANLGLQQLIVQDKDGDDPKLQAGLQGFQALRGAISTVFLFAIAQPLANFFDVPEVVWAYQILAIQPLLLSLYHFDMHRLRRQMRFMPSVMVDVMPALLSLLLVFPLVYVYDDYRLMLWALMAQAGIGLITSHLVAERKFQLTFEREIIKRSVVFGWPLFINGALLFIMMNGERMVVGRELGMASLAMFSMGFTLTLTPTLVVARSTQAFFLPQLSAVQDVQDKFRSLSYATMQVSLLNGMALILAIILIGEPFVEIVLGDKFAPLVPLMIWFGILHGVRVFKSGCAVVALARAKTENAMIANSFRVLSLPLSYYVAVTSGDLKLVIWIATLGELLGYIAALLLVRYRVGLELDGMMWPLISAGVFCIVASCFGVWGGLALQIATCALFVIYVFNMKSFWAYLKARQMVTF